MNRRPKPDAIEQALRKHLKLKLSYECPFTEENEHEWDDKYFMSDSHRYVTIDFEAAAEALRQLTIQQLINGTAA